jgi:acyl-CoA thioesterase-1
VLRRPFILPFALIVCGLVAACGTGRETVSSEGTSAPQPSGNPAPEAPTRDAGRRTGRPAGTPRIVFLGDSLTAGLGLPETGSYPALLQDRLDKEGYNYEVVNAGVSGDTSAGGVRRLDWSLEGNVRILLVALGANDGLRGLPVDELRRNLSTVIERGKARGVTVILAGMEAPPNNGPEYTAAFRSIYSDLARQHQVPLIPFLLQGVAGDTALNQTDGIHPNARGAQLIADLVWSTLRPALSNPAPSEQGAKPGESKGQK